MSCKIRPMDALLYPKYEWLKRAHWGLEKSVRLITQNALVFADVNTAALLNPKTSLLYFYSIIPIHVVMINIEKKNTTELTSCSCVASNLILNVYLTWCLQRCYDGLWFRSFISYWTLVNLSTNRFIIWLGQASVSCYFEWNYDRLPHLVQL